MLELWVGLGRIRLAFTLGLKFGLDKVIFRGLELEVVLEFGVMVRS